MNKEYTPIDWSKSPKAKIIYECSNMDGKELSINELSIPVKRDGGFLDSSDKNVVFDINIKTKHKKEQPQRLPDIFY